MPDRYHQTWSDEEDRILLRVAQNVGGRCDECGGRLAYSTIPFKMQKEWARNHPGEPLPRTYNGNMVRARHLVLRDTILDQPFAGNYTNLDQPFAGNYTNLDQPFADNYTNLYQLFAEAQAAIGQSSVTNDTNLDQPFVEAQAAIGQSSITNDTNLDQLFAKAQAAIGQSSVTNDTNIYQPFVEFQAAIGLNSAEYKAAEDAIRMAKVGKPCEDCGRDFTCNSALFKLQFTFQS